MDLPRIERPAAQHRARVKARVRNSFSWTYLERCDFKPHGELDRVVDGLREAGLPE